MSLTGRPDRLGGVDGLHHEIGNDLAAEAPAQERDVDRHLVGGASERLGNGVLTGRDRLHRSPDLNGAVLVAGRRVARLVRGMGDVWKLEAPLDDRRRARFKDLSRLASNKRSDATLRIQCGVQRGLDLGGREIAVHAAVERHIERDQRAPRLPEMVRNDAHGVVARRPRNIGTPIPVVDRRDLHHGAHAGHLEDRVLVLDRGHLTGEGRRRHDRGVEHAGDVDVDAVDRAAVALGRRIQSRDRLADQAKSAAVLQRWRGAQRKLGGGRCELTIGQPFAAGVDDEAVLGAALGGIDAPRLRCGADQHLARGGTGGAQPLVEHRGRHRGALLLDGGLLPKCDLVGLPAGHELNLDAVPVRIELVGKNLGQGGVRALSDFWLRQSKCHQPA